MSDLLNIGASAVRAYQGALSVVGENVANSESPGYARRTAVLRQAPTPGASTDPVYGDQTFFGGVEFGGVQRQWDSFRANESRFAASAAGSAGVRQQWLTAVETSFGSGATTVGSSMTAFFNAATALAAKPDDRLVRIDMLATLEDVSAAFRVTAGSLGRVAEGIQAAAKLDVDAVNSALQTLHEINGSLQTSTPGGAGRAALEDQRDELIDFVAERVDISVTLAANGTVELRLAGASATSLVNGLSPALLRLGIAEDGRISLQISKEGTIGALPVTAGRLAGLLQVAGSTADRRSALDDLAGDFADAINSWSAAGRDEAGVAGVALLDAAGGAATMQRLVADPAAIAAASADGTPNGNLLALDALRGADGPEARWTRLVADAAQSLAGARSEAAAASSWRDNSLAALDEFTGVDLDREAADMLRYQQAYGAATRIIQVARETINEILDLF